MRALPLCLPPPPSPPPQQTQGHDALMQATEAAGVGAAEPALVEQLATVLAMTAEQLAEVLAEQ